ncbi:MAG: Nif3-like dinuclear metal center hexameric protein [Planctomycetota bacterium]
MPTLADLTAAFESFAPLALAEPWDNAGLILGSPEETLDGPVLLAVDLTSRVADELLASRASALVAYHPPIFEPISRLDGGDRLNHNILTLARAGVGVYSPHTALDNAPDGLNDWLAGTLGEGDIRALRIGSQPGPAMIKIVTFVPADHADRVRMALASAGAGRIGRYELCSFNTEGVGTFLPGEGAAPAVGEAGVLRHVPEVRLEMVCPASAEAIATETLRGLHPYEEPAFDLFDLRPSPSRNAGAGRRVMLDQPATIGELAGRVKRRLGIDKVKIAMPRGDESKPVHRIGVCAGAGASLTDDALRNDCDLFLTGEMRHHEVMALLRRGVGVILAGHTNTERPFLKTVGDRLASLGFDARVCESDQTSLRWF